MKKTIATVLVALLALGLAFAGGSKDTKKPSGGTYNIVMEVVKFGQQWTGIADVEAAINAITEPEIGVTVTINPVDAWNLITTTGLEVTSGNQLDLALIMPMGAGMDSISNYTSKNMLEPLDDLYAQYGKDIAPVIGDLIKLGYLGGTLYAIPCNYNMGNGYAFDARTDILKELGFENYYSKDKVYTLDDLEPLFAAYKAKYGDGYYAIALFGSQNPFDNTTVIDNFGDSANGGIVNNLKSTTVTNIYATKEFSDFAKRARQWYLKGYINPDSTTITDAWPTLVAGGNYLGSFSSLPGMSEVVVAANSRSAQHDLTPIKIVADYGTTGMASYGLWGIPVTSKNPEKVMQFLNLWYQDRELSKDIDTMLMYGLEGKTYKVVEKGTGSKAVIDYADGVNPMNAPYEGGVPVYGNTFTQPQMVPGTLASYNNDINGDIVKAGRLSAAFGYTFDDSRVVAQKSAVQSVIQQYEALLTHGVVDPDVVLPEFLKALDQAGYDKVIAENQRQLNEWLKTKK